YMPSVTLQLSATDGTNSTFQYWEVDNPYSTDSNNTITHNVIDSVTTTAYFSESPLPPVPPKVYYITATSDGMTSISPTGTVTLSRGASQTFSFSANDGLYIEAVIVDGRNLSQAEIDLGHYTFSNVSMNHTIKVIGSNEPRTTVTLRIDVTSGNGYAEYSVNGGPFIRYTGVVTLPDNADVTVRAFADDGYKFKEWRDGSGVHKNSEYSMYGLMAPVSLELYFTDDSSILDGPLFWWIVGAALLLLLAALLLWFILFYRRTYEVIEVVGAVMTEKDRARRKRAYTFTLEGVSGTLSYRVGEEGAWNVLLPNPDGSYTIPGKDVIDKITIEHR
ncbi:MAG: hypothetical protein FWG60_01880, partial [Methanomassiliicoccaceae archaeon]|nr:hypothetical protein [Methanomassiliicoccaceae archaeon]